MTTVSMREEALLTTGTPEEQDPMNDSDYTAAYWKGMTLIVTAYFACFAVGSIAGWLSPYEDPLYVGFVADVAATITIFLFSMALRNSSFYDAYWSVAPMGIVVYWGLEHWQDGNPVRILLIIACTFLWGIRLTYNWARGWGGLHHEDWRYVNIHKQTGIFYWPASFLAIHFFPTLLVFAGLWPAYEAMTLNTPIGWLDWLAVALAILATALEYIADQQMYDFRNSNPPKGSIMQSGLWKYSRHPNYLGEIIFWLSLFVFALATSEQFVGTIVGVTAMAALFRFISIPMMETRQRARRPAYENYMAMTSMLLILPRKSLPPSERTPAAEVHVEEDVESADTPKEDAESEV